MKKWQVIYSEQGLRDLRKIYQYIAYELLVPETASKQSDRIMSEIESLDEMPMRCPLFEKEPWKSRGLRKLVVDNYIAFYLPIEKSQQVLIVSIMYGGRNVDEILTKLQD